MRAEKLSRPWVDDDIAGRQPLDPLRPGRSRGWTMRDDYPAAVRAEVIAAAAAVAEDRPEALYDALDRLSELLRITPGEVEAVIRLWKDQARLS